MGKVVPFIKPEPRKSRDKSEASFLAMADLLIKAYQGMPPCGMVIVGIEAPEGYDRPTSTKGDDSEDTNSNGSGAA